MVKWVVSILAFILSDKRLVETIINLAKILAARSTTDFDDKLVIQIERLLKYIPDGALKRSS